MDAVTVTRVAIALIPTVKKIHADRKAIKALRSERKFYEDLAAETRANQEPIRVTCERLA